MDSPQTKDISTWFGTIGNALGELRAMEAKEISDSIISAKQAGLGMRLDSNTILEHWPDGYRLVISITTQMDYDSKKIVIYVHPTENVEKAR